MLYVMKQLLCYVMKQLSVLCFGAAVCAMLWSLLVSIIDDRRWFFDAFNGMHPEVTPVEGTYNLMCWLWVW